jgi:4-amino-4-deoxy-L-arabinose transferase-like glycosyltransferase
MPDAVTRPATSATTLLNAWVADVLRALATLFEVTAPLEREGALPRLLLAVVLGIGTLVRFWNLGGPGLHGDEETMAMATMHILKDGWPILPSGMFYPRGLTELYLMALSVLVFGESEWAFRLPSALCGVLVIALTYLVGRRFLRPQWNLALAATVALLPQAIVYSQTARMYIFLLAAIAGCMACLFEWERSGRLRWLVGAVVTLTVGIELHTLAVTAALLFLLPGVLKGDARKIVQGLIACVVIMVAFLGIDAWVNSQYPVPPPEYAADIALPSWRGSRPTSYPREFQVVLLLTGALTAVFAVHLGRKVPQRLPAFCAALLLFIASVLQVMLFYHLAVLFGLAGAVVAYRAAGPIVLRRLWIFILSSAAVGLIQVTFLASRPGSVVKLVGVLIGQPSVWPYVRISQFSVCATVLAFCATVWGLWRVANRQRAPDYALLALLGLWIPMFVVGLFVWDMPSRYAAASLLPMLVSAFALVQHAFDWLAQRSFASGWLRSWRPVAALLTLALVVEPPQMLAMVKPSKGMHPDHRGAAQFVRSQNITPDDILIAEDVLQQTYYLGEVDYWLISRKHARLYVQRVDGVIRDFYTSTRVIGSGQELEHVLDAYGGRRIFIIGSGENKRDGRREMRGFGIYEVLMSDRLEEVYLGSDGATKVWRAGPARAESARQGERHASLESSAIDVTSAAPQAVASGD